MKITKTHLSRIIQEELAATNLQEAPLPADEYKETVDYLWSQNLSHIVLPFKHATNLDGEFPPAIKTIVDYWEKKDFKGMASEFIDLRDELDEWLKSRGFNWSIRTEKDPGSRYVDYSIDGRKGRTSRDSIDTNFKHAFRLIRMLINNPPPSRGYTGFGVANSNPSFMRQQAIDADTLGRRQTQEGKNKMKITKTHLARIIQEEVAKSIKEGMMLEQQNVEKAAELAANMKDTPEVEAIFATLDKDPEAQKALKSILAQLPDENIEEAEDLDPAGGIATAATFLMVGNTMYQVAAGKALMGAVIAAGLPIAAGLTGLALVALAMKYVRNKKGKAAMRARDGKSFSAPLNEGKKITKSNLARIIQEEVAKSIEEGMMDAIGAIKDKLSPKRPAKAPYQKSENDKEEWRLMGVRDAEDAMHISGDYRESPSSDDEDYMAGWNDTIQGANSAMQEGKNKIKITKSTLAQIVQEELSAVTAEGYGNYKRDDKKPKRGKKDLGEAEGRYEFELDPKVQQSVLDALAKSGTGALDFPLPLTPEQEKYYSHLDDGDRQSMLQDVVEELVELGKIKVIKVADGLLYYAVQGLDNDWGDLEEEEIYALEALMSLGGDQPAGDIAAIASEKYENAIGTEEREDFGADIQTALDSLQAKGKVRLTQDEPGSGGEAFYAIA